MRYCPNPECPDVQRTGTPAEYYDDVSRCGDCGVDLVGEPPVFEDERSPTEREPAGAGTVVFTHFSPEVPALVVAKLRSAGIAAELDDRSIHFHRWLVSGHDDVRVLVPRADAEAARQLLDEIREADLRDGAPSRATKPKAR